MRKLAKGIFLSGIIATVLGISSCSKTGDTYTCTCYGGVTGVPSSHGIVAHDRATAKQECEKDNPAQTPANYYCELE